MLSPVRADLPGLTVVAPPDGMGKLSQIGFMACAIQRQATDVFYAHYASEYVCWLAGLMNRHPFAIHAMGSDVLLDALGQNGSVRAWLTRRALRRADLLTVKSPFIADALLTLGISRHRVHEVIWGIDPATCCRDETARRDWRAHWKADDGAPVILSPRPLNELYRAHLLIEAMPAILAARPDALVVVSEYNQDAAYRERLAARAADLGVAARLRFQAPVTAEAMPGLLSAADLVISFAYTDGTPQTVLEAQAVSTPVLFTDIPDIRPVFTHDADCWMTAPDPAAIAQAVTGPLADIAVRKRIIAGGQTLIETRASFPKEVERVEALLQGIARCAA